MIDVRAFRKSLRVFEQFLNNQLQDCCCGLSVAQCHCLFAIEELGKTTVSELALYLNLDKSTLSRTVDGLFRKGLVNRYNDLNDRRIFKITLTNAGLEQVELMHSVNDTYFSKIFDQIPATDQAALVKYIKIFVDAITQEELVHHSVDRSLDT